MTERQRYRWWSAITRHTEGRVWDALWYLLTGAFVLFVLAAVFSAFSHAADPPVAIEVFTDGRVFPIIGLDGPERIRMYDLAAPDRVTASLSRNLPADPRTAAEIARARLTPQAIEAIGAAYAGHQRALELGITKVPAMVFDGGTAVVYGVRDVGAAMALYRRWRGGR